MRRREFITLLGGTVAGWPLAARAQQPAAPAIGYLSAADADFNVAYVAAVRDGLSEGGIERNTEILFRYADYRFDRLPELAGELVRRGVKVIVSSGVAPSLAAKAATSTIPIVFESAVDPVANGLVANLNRPGGNVTGVTLLAEAFYIKGLEFLHELVPQARSVAVLINPTNPAGLGLPQVEEAARTLGLRLTILKASNLAEIEQAFAALGQDRVGGILVNSDRLFQGQYGRLIEFANRQRVPAIYWERKVVQAGGLISYGAMLEDAHRIVGTYVARILKGEKPVELPVLQPTEFELVINLGTAKALGLDVPPALLARADEVIE
jgi:putative ABC transport system substrate-binding protein